MVVEQAVWEAQPRQREFLHRTEDEVLYGGAAGGGKTDALLIHGITRAITYPGSRHLFMRRTFKDLALPGAAIDRSRQLLTGMASWRASDYRWEFPDYGGSVFAFAHLENISDMYNYQGAQLDTILFDELTQFPEEPYQFMRSRNRATVPGIKPTIRAGTNPGNVGHGWVRKRWVDAAPWGEPFPIRAESGAVIASGCFIPARVSDNQRLLERDPGYATRLEGLPEHLRRAYLDGDWDIFAGQVFTEWRRDKHVVRAFVVPKEWPRWCGVDFGYGAPWCCLWLARAPSGVVYVYREAYQKGLSDWDQAKRIRRESHGEDVRWVVADPSAFSRQPNGKSIADVYFESGGIRLSRGNNDRLSGWQRVHEYLRLGVEGLDPGLQVFDTCRNLIRTLPALVYDDHKVEDVDHESGEGSHACDALRYALMASKVRPAAGPVLRDFVATM